MRKKIGNLTLGFLIVIMGIIMSSEVFASNMANESSSSARSNGRNDYILKAGDKISLTVFPTDEFIKGGEMEISPEGNVTIPVVGKVLIAGKSVIEAQETIVDILQEDYFIDPEAVIEVLDYEDLKVVILGQVRKPGNYSFPPGANQLTLLQCISLAGGFSDIANIKKIKIMRKNESGKAEKISANANDIIEGKKQDIILKPDDVIHVPESFF